ncbi:MAG: glycosyltransferase [Symploca sp. SIO2E6]|nr:glycosyltransferase [Symploca sp. SIO2E6]
MNTSVSVIITTFNKAQYLEQSVNSVLGQTLPNVECLIVDDGSTDHTQQVVEHLVNLNPQLQYFYKENGGVSDARNFGAQKATGEWIQFLDADDWLHQDKLQFQLSCLQGSGENVVLYSDYERVYVDQEGEVVQTVPHIVGDLTKEQLIERLLICPDFLADSPFPLLQQSMLFQRTLLQQKGFDPKLQACEDREFVLELLLKGVEFVYVPMIGAYYRKHRFNLTDNEPLMRESYIRYFELVQQHHQQLLPLCQKSIQYLLEQTFAQKDRKNFQRLGKLAEFPVYLWQGRIKVNNLLLLEIIYLLRSIIPNLLLYERYRGPRSRRLLSLVLRD